MNWFLAVFVLSACLYTCHSMKPPSYAKCVRLENDTEDTVYVSVEYDDGSMEKGSVFGGKSLLFPGKEHKEGSYYTVIPVTSVAVGRYDNHIEVIHDIEVQGVVDCVDRVVTSNGGLLTVEKLD